MDKNSISSVLSDNSDFTDRPLGLLFNQVKLIHDNQDYITSKCRNNPEVLEKALATCRHTNATVESAGLFSSNDDAEDIPTAELKFLLVPYYLAELLGTCPAPEGPTQRLPLVTEAQAAYTTFLHRCSQYKLHGELGSKLIKQEEEQVRW